MDDQSISAVVAELSPLLINRAPGRIFRISEFAIAIDFGLRAYGYLLVSAEPTLPRIHLIKRPVRHLEQTGFPQTQFALHLRKELSGTVLRDLEKVPQDRIVKLRFTGADEFGAERMRTLIAQLTGRSANLFLLDQDEVILHAARSDSARAAHLSQGQNTGDVYRAQSHRRQPRPSSLDGALYEMICSGRFASASEAADSYFTSLLSARAFEAKAGAARATLKKKLFRQANLIEQLQRDLKAHAHAEDHKRVGDLLLANLGTARREGNRVFLTDYFADDAPTIEVESDEQLSLQEEAARRFEQYSRSKRAVTQIKLRLAATQKVLCDLESQGRTLQTIIESEDQVALDRFLSTSARMPSDPKRAVKSPSKSFKIPGTRRYISSDGFEILVGRADRDNDQLTFKVAKPNDLWLHAADYGGSHVIVRNATRREVPHRTVIEAAELAAHFSQARKDPKVDVHYTQRKSVSKPKGAKPGLVRLSRFKNITVVPQEKLERI